nr:primosomal replication protein [Klebsiella pneumoniae subsp. pneumoniae]
MWRKPNTTLTSSPAVERQQLPQVVWIAERLAAQIAALRRETATWSFRQLGPRVANVEPLAAPSPAASGGERRLLAMRDQRQRQQAQATSLDEQQRLGKEEPTAAGWRAADRRDKIENVLARLTR